METMTRRPYGSLVFAAFPTLLTHVFWILLVSSHSWITIKQKYSKLLVTVTLGFFKKKICIKEYSSSHRLLRGEGNAHNMPQYHPMQVPFHSPCPFSLDYPFLG